MKFDGSKGTKELRIKDKNQKAFFFREGASFEKNRLVTGADKRVPSGETTDDFYHGKVLEGSVTIYKEVMD